jgi:hypothetical protein
MSDEFMFAVPDNIQYQFGTTTAQGVQLSMASARTGRERVQVQL